MTFASLIPTLFFLHFCLFSGTIPGFICPQNMYRPDFDNASPKESFQFELKTKRPLWKDAMMSLGIGMILWSGSQFFLNFSAYSTVMAFKWDMLVASVVEAAEEVKVAARGKTLEQIEHKSIEVKKAIPKNAARSTFRSMGVIPSDNRIYLPRINKNVPLVTVPTHKNWKQLEQNIQTGLQNGVVVHPVSRTPGNNGNFFITGHSSYYKWDPGRFKDVFALLHEVQVGDTVEVYWEGKKHVYRIREEKVVAPTEVGVLDQPKDESILTLMTCTPIGTNRNRLILVAEEI